MSPVDMLRRRAERVYRAVEAQVPPGAVAAAFVAGSVARDEVRACRVDGVLEIYSDIDLYLVVTPASIVEVRAATRRVLADLPEDEKDAGVRFLRGVDAGVYTREDLLAQPVRPGTVDLSRAHFLFDGDASLIAALCTREERPMPAHEALYLIENRLLEEHNATSPRLSRVTALKIVVDAGCAALIPEGRWRPLLAERMREIETRVPAALGPAALAEVRAAHAGLCELGTFLSGAATADEFGRALSFATAQWLLIAERMRGDGDAGRLLGWRSREGTRLDHLREARQLHRRAAPGGHTMGGLWRLGARSPVAALRLHALATGLARAGSISRDALAAHTDYMDRLTRCLGFRDGTLDERVRALSARLNEAG